MAKDDVIVVDGKSQLRYFDKNMEKKMWNFDKNWDLICSIFTLFIDF